MAFMYCVQCNYELYSPNTEEVLEGGINCPDCGSFNDIGNAEELKNELILDLVRRIDILEHKLESLKSEED